MSVAFWSAVVKVGKSCEVQPPDGYVLNLQQAALVDHEAKGSVVLKAHSVSIEGDKIEAVLGTLRPSTCDQFSMGESSNLSKNAFSKMQYSMHNVCPATIHFQEWFSDTMSLSNFPWRALARPHLCTFQATSNPDPMMMRKKRMRMKMVKKLIYRSAPIIKNQRQVVLKAKLTSLDEGMDEEMYKKLLAEGGKEGADSDGKN